MVHVAIGGASSQYRVILAHRQQPKFLAIRLAGLHNEVSREHHDLPPCKLAFGIGVSLLFIPTLFAASANQPPGLLSDPVDSGSDFHDFTNTFFLADTLATFDPAAATISWRRHQMAPRIAFDNMEPVLRPFAGETFPDREYAVNPTLPFSIQFVSPRTVRIRIKTGDTSRPDIPSLMLVGEPPRDTSRRFWLARVTTGKTSAAGLRERPAFPWTEPFTCELD
ncbi:MAG: hypothetical protein ABSH45_06960 [Bryobacteraceae bacterium]